jgi:hypothetical protein
MSGVNVSNLNRQYRQDFPGTSLPTDWALLSLGAGMTYSVSASELVVNAGTTASSETIFRSTVPITVKCIARFIAKLSQRIANQNVYLELVNQTQSTWVRFNFNGTTATSVQVESANNGTANSAISLTSSTSASYAAYEIFADLEDVLFNTGTSNSNAARTGARVDRLILQPDEQYFAQLRVTNGATAPASATTVYLDALLLEDINTVNVELCRAAGDSNAATAMPIRVLGGTVDTITLGYVAPKATRFTDSTTALAASGVFTGTGRDSGATVSGANVSALVYAAGGGGTLYIEQSPDNTTFYRVNNPTSMMRTISAGETGVVTVPLVMRYWRVVFANAAVAQTAFRLDSIISF